MGRKVKRMGFRKQEARKDERNKETNNRSKMNLDETNDVTASSLSAYAIHPTAKIHPTAIIYENVFIDAWVEIGPYCVIGAPAERDGDWENKGVHIRRGAILHGFNTVDAGTQITTYIGDNTQLLKHAHVGHDATIGQNCVLSCGSRIGGHADISDHCNIGLNASVHQWVTVPTGVMLGMNSCITKKTLLASYNIYAGVPARWIKQNTVLLKRLGK